ncbi:MAG: imidazolonepropionase [Fervidobacterium sp.]
MFIINADRLLSPVVQPSKGDQMKCITEDFDVDIVIEDGKIVDIRKHKNAHIHASLVTPGFFDAHTHIPFIGSRAKEFLMRAKGKSYIDILNAGGGIYYTSRFVRNATEDELYLVSKSYIDKLTSYGVVGLECKSGYGLDLENELKQLRVIKRLKTDLPNKIASTFLGLHAKPLINSEKKDENTVKEYIEAMKNLLDVVKVEKLAEFVDAFVDKGVYLPQEVENFFLKAKELGFKIRLHADEIENVGASIFGVKIGALSVDHVLKISDEDIKTLSASNTMVTLMPSTSFYLGECYAPARKLIDSGIPVALGSDFNPGSCPIYLPAFVMHLAIRFLRMEPEEVLNAYTVNSAHLLGFKSGIIKPDFPADLILWKTSDFLDVAYMFQENFVEHVFIDGRMVV